MTDDSIIISSESMLWTLEALAIEMGVTRPTPVVAALIERDRVIAAIEPAPYIALEAITGPLPAIDSRARQRDRKNAQTKAGRRRARVS